MSFAAPHIEDEANKKLAYALQLLYMPHDPFKAATRVLGFNDPGVNHYVAQYWPHDLDVRREMVRLIEEHGEAHFMPSLEAVAGEVYAYAQSADEGDLKLKAYRLYAEIRGFIQKPGTVITHNQNYTDLSKVLVIKDHGTEDEWEQKLIEQQARLVANA